MPRSADLQTAVKAALEDKQRRADEREPSDVEKVLAEQGRNLRAMRKGAA